LRDFKSTEIITLAEQLNVSCDYLLGRSRAAAPDEFIQKVVERYGLSEEALQTLERLNAPLNIDGAEQERIVAKQIAYEATESDYTILELVALTNELPQPARQPKIPLTKEEFQTIRNIMQDETNKQILHVLNEILTTSTGGEWGVFGMQILNAIFDYCHREYQDINQTEYGRTGRTYYIIKPETQRNLKLYELNDTLSRLRDKLIQDADKQGG
jgi:hypothetical protein